MYGSVVMLVVPDQRHQIARVPSDWGSRSSDQDPYNFRRGPRTSSIRKTESQLLPPDTTKPGPAFKQDPYMTHKDMKVWKELVWTTL